jgi:phosphoglycerate dehydrogenase-like enzyme
MACVLHFELGVTRLAVGMRTPPFHFQPPFHRRPIDAAGQLGNPPFRSELKGKTIGIVGLGKIGNQVAARAASFGVRLVATRTRAQVVPPVGIEWVGGEADIDRLFQESDYVVLACPLTPATTGLVDERRLGLMKPTAVLLNVARGPVVNEEDLYIALKGGTIRGAAIDVWYRYPKPGADQTGVPPSKFPFHELDPETVLLTPHSSGWTLGQEVRKAQQIAANLDAIADGVTPSFIIRASQRKL